MASPCYSGAFLTDSKEHEFLNLILLLLLLRICPNMLKVDCIVTSVMQQKITTWRCEKNKQGRKD